MNAVAEFFKSRFSLLGGGLRRFPESAAMSLATVATLVLANHSPRQLWADDLVYWKLAGTFGLGFLLFLCVRRALERFPGLSAPARASALVAAACFLALYYAAGWPKADTVSFARLLALAFSAAVAFLSLPFLARRDGFSGHAVKVALRLLVTYLFATVLLAGLVALLATWNLLFNAGISERVYLDLWLLAWGLFAPVFFLAEVPREGESAAGWAYPPVLRGLLLYLVMPLMAAYAATLTIYCAKILVTFTWPDGTVAPMVLWYAIFAVTVAVAIDPIGEASQWRRRWTTATFWNLVPLLFMMFGAVWIRARVYGVTEGRYLAVAGGVWLLGFSLYVGSSRRARLVWPVLFAPAFALVAAFGPLSCFEVSVWSQNRRVEAILAQGGMLRGGRAVPAAADRALSGGAREDVRSILKYFDGMHGLERVRCLPPGTSLWEAHSILGLTPDYGASRPTAGRYSHELSPGGTPLDISGFTACFPAVTFPGHGPDDGGRPASPDGLWRMELDAEKGSVQFSRSGSPAFSFDLKGAALEIHRRLGEAGRGGASEMTFRRREGGVETLVLFHRLSGEEGGVHGPSSLLQAEFTLFLREVPR